MSRRRSILCRTSSDASSSSSSSSAANTNLCDSSDAATRHVTFVGSTIRIVSPIATTVESPSYEASDFGSLHAMDTAIATDIRHARGRRHSRSSSFSSLSGLSGLTSTISHLRGIPPTTVTEPPSTKSMESNVSSPALTISSANLTHQPPFRKGHRRGSSMTQAAHTESPSREAISEWAKSSSKTFSQAMTSFIL